MKKSELRQIIREELEKKDLYLKGVLKKEEYDEDEIYYVDFGKHSVIPLHIDLRKKLGNKIDRLLGKQLKWKTMVWDSMSKRLSDRYRVIDIVK